MILIIGLMIWLFLYIIIMMNKINGSDSKQYRKMIGGDWYYITFTYKRDNGMSRLTEFMWCNQSNLFLFQNKDNFEILKTENYEKRND